MGKKYPFNRHHLVVLPWVSVESLLGIGLFLAVAICFNVTYLFGGKIPATLPSVTAQTSPATTDWVKYGEDYLQSQQYGYVRMHAGELPFWNPYVRLGVPQLDQMTAAPLEPLKLILYWLPSFGTFWVVLITLRLWMSGLGVFRWLRELKLPFWPAVIGGLSWMLGGAVATQVFLPSGATLCWLGWLFCTSEIYMSKPQPKRLIPVALSVTAILLGGDLAMAVVVLGLWLSYLAGLMVIRWLDHGVVVEHKTTLQQLVLAFGVGCLLALPMIFAVVGRALMQGSLGALIRIPVDIVPATVFWTFDQKTAAVRALLQALLLPPLIAGGSETTVHLDMYAGVVVWLLALVAVVYARQSRRLWLLLSWVVGGLVMLVLLPNTWMWNTATAVPSLLLRFKVILLFPLAILSAFGLRSLIEKVSWRRLLPIWIVLLAGVELALAHGGLWPELSRDLWQPVDATMNFLHQKTVSQERVLILPEVKTAVPMTQFFQASGSVEPVALSALPTETYMGGWSAQAGQIEIQKNIWNLAGVRYVLAGDWKQLAASNANSSLETSLQDRGFGILQKTPRLLLENMNYLPKAYVVNSVQTFGTVAAANAFMVSNTVDFSKQAVVVLASTNSNIESMETTTPLLQTGTKVKMLNYQSEQMALQVTTTQDGLMVINDRYDGNWSASIDHMGVNIYNADGGLRGIFIPSGNRHVELRYHETAFYLGLLGTIGGSVILLFWLLIDFSRVRRELRAMKKDFHIR